MDDQNDFDVLDGVLYVRGRVRDQTFRDISRIVFLDDYAELRGCRIFTSPGAPRAISQFVIAAPDTQYVRLIECIVNPGEPGWTE